MRGNYKTLFLRGQNLTAVEGSASAYQVYPVSRITGEGGAEHFEGHGGIGLNKSGRGRGIGGVTQNVRENYKSFKGINLTVS